MKLFENAQDLAAAIGLELDDRPPERPGFPAEADWGIRLSGQGQPGGMHRGGWLVTRAQPWPASEEGHLIAYEVNAQNARTGRCALLRTPWPYDLDNAELARVRASGYWEPRGEQGEMNIDVLDGMLAGTRL